MSKLNVQMCPETGICSIIKENGTKVDIISHEVNLLRQASGDTEKFKSVLAQVDSSFSQALTDEELAQLSNELN